MALYTPPDKSSPPKAHENEEDKGGSNREQDDIKKFYVRPSLGLRLWGPLVPASDNKMGLWSLIGIQTAVGTFCLHRIRVLRASMKFVSKDIANIPSLNRFSKTHGAMVLNPVNNPLKKPLNSNSRFRQLFSSPRWSTFKNVVYLLTGTLLLSQSLLEASRLTILKYDPWYEEAKSVRDKKFFNDIIQFYHEGIDPTKVKVKDATNGNVMSTNIPEVKQSVALVRAQAEAENPIIKWFGPIEYKPMSFTEYLDRMEYHLDIDALLHDKRTLKENQQHLNTQITHTEGELDSIVRHNQEVKERTKDLVKNAPEGSMALSSVASQGFPLRSVILEVDPQDPDSMDLNEVWSLYDPWMNLALDTSLSIKFLPTVMSPESQSNQNQNDSQDDHETKTE
ncbi:hypothetical protein ZYGR_0W00760 [Zygosaccharomyces rouxii]|uniref:ZYRO0F17930p n=2 Tax=Zygosaccharomyces rouxii TaxID=4956 RepID=C5DZ37_ZYGRC|nr:uncharacterized protein ZYRO0F17930g [Zygosaccharomyces rouxii]KAH9201241.1 mitochondrial inner membrane i-AAA protease complex subunit MGR1 [Zygosaccharomyces rouxii]GAV50550.1 hypothetical protein ZYGR_0W00760 [Zygosaccharomyces rouxii]CAQ43326.1 Mitochondrial inner membrane i-AAA protease complex subunit MGR1 [Zygosaccharomyces rouxii]CAR29048.1 ZYRO0F17930p [Zygosaccharomyces rouxii]